MLFRFIVYGTVYGSVIEYFALILKFHTRSFRPNKLHHEIFIFLKKQVWSLVRRFDEPQKYKPFVRRCIVNGNVEIGSVREVDVRSGLPATTSTERLELLDDDQHILSVKIVGGDHRLRVLIS